MRQLVCSSMAVWMVNVVTIAVLLVRVFVYGEPVVCRKGFMAETFWRHRKQADLDMAKVRDRMCLTSVSMFNVEARL